MPRIIAASVGQALSLAFAAAVLPPLAGASFGHAQEQPLDPASNPSPDDATDADRARAAAEAERQDAERQAAAASAEAGRLAALRVEAAARLRTTENEVSDRATDVSDLAEKRAAAAARLERRAAALGPLLPLVERLALFPAETLLAAPAPPEQTILSLTILRGIARGLEQEAVALRQEQDQLAAAARAVDAAVARLKSIQAEQTEQARELDRQIVAAQALREQAEAAGAAAARQAADAADRATSIRSALAEIEAARVRAEAQARQEAERAERKRQQEAAAAARERETALARPAGPGPGPNSALVTPVAGRVLRNWGDDTDAGPSNGIASRPAPEARVVAPCAGRIRFAAPFRSYGSLIILDCGGGYAFVLAGLGRLDVTPGARVLAGEPVGVMPDWDAAADAPRPALYIELRHDGKAVDPAPFLQARG